MRPPPQHGLCEAGAEGEAVAALPLSRLRRAEAPAAGGAEEGGLVRRGGRRRRRAGEAGARSGVDRG